MRRNTARVAWLMLWLWSLGGAPCLWADTAADMSAVLLTQGDAARQERRFDLALHHYLAALAAREQALGTQHPDLVPVLDRLGNTYRALHQPAEAVRVFTRSLAIDEQQHGPGHLDVAGDCANIAASYAAAGDYAQALPYYERALHLYATAQGEAHLETLMARNNYAVALLELWRAADALPHLEQVVHGRTAALGPQHAETLIARLNYATTLGALGRDGEALAQYTQLLTVSSSLLGDTHPVTLAALDNYATTLKSVGRIADALPLYERALRLRTETLGPLHPETLTTLRHHAAALEALGRAAEALPLHEHAWRQLTTILGEQHPLTLKALDDYAGTLASLERLGDALPLYERVLAQRTTVLGTTHPDTLASRNNYAYILEISGRATEALPHYAAVLRDCTAVLGPQHPRTLTALTNYAGVLHALGRLDDALPVYEQGLHRVTEVLGAHHPQTLTVMNNYATALRLHGRVDDALPLYARFVAGAEAHRDAAGRDSAASQRGVLGRYIHGYHQYLLALHETGHLSELLGALERTKARTLLEQMTLRSAATSSVLPAADATRLRTYADRLGTLDTRLAQATEAPERQALHTERNTASRELAALKQHLQERYPRFRQISEVQLVTSAHARTLIPPEALFISYVVMGRAFIKAITVDHAGAVHWTALANLPGLAESVEALRMWSANLLSATTMADDTGRPIQIVHWREDDLPRWRVVVTGQPCTPPADQRPHTSRGARSLTLAPEPATSAVLDCLPPGAAVVHGETAYQALVTYLGQTLLTPLKAHLAGKTQLIISPDGPLGLVPWDILPLDGQPLIAQFAVSQIQSLSVLHLLRTRQAAYGQSTEREELLSIGNPEYTLPDSSPARGMPSAVLRSPMRQDANPAEMLRQLQWTNLPGTQAEMDQAASIFAGHSRVISGKAANETTLRHLSATGELARYRYVHFAAHGYFDPNFPAYSSLVLAPEGPEPERDGYVTVGEWVGLHLRSDLTLLSACNTARGETVSGEGLLGLAYGLYVAGNTNAVLTLWPVADEESAEFVSSLLRNIKAGQTHVQAITATKREFLTHATPQKRNPYFWAPFVLYGM